MTSLGAYAPIFRSILRIVAGLLFLAHGTSKFFGIPPTGMPSPELFSLFGLAGVIETVGGVLLILGLFTRPAAFIMSGEAAAAYFIAHAPQNFYPLLNGGESAVLFAFLFLYFVFAGPGPLSLDRTIRGRA